MPQAEIANVNPIANNGSIFDDLIFFPNGFFPVNFSRCNNYSPGVGDV